MRESFCRKASFFALFLGYFSTGLSIPAMSLLVLSKGFSLASLGVSAACFSAAVLVFELPSGLFCDAKGRKNGYLIGQMLSILGTICLFSSSFPVLCTGFALNGVGRAMGSGSLDALLIRSHVESGKSLDGVVVTLNAGSSIALSSGSLAGGVLLGFGEPGVRECHPLLAGKLLVLCIGVVVAFVFVSEPKRGAGTKSDMRFQAKRFLAGVRTIPFLSVFLVFSLLQGLLLSTVESYWQPYLQHLLVSSQMMWLYGVVGGIAFGCSLLGTFAGKCLMTRIPSRWLCPACFLGALGALVAMSFSDTALAFCCLYGALYFFLGVSSVTGDLLTNAAAREEIRSSVLSANSLALQLGGLFSGIVATNALRFLSLSAFWVGTAGCCAVVLLGILRPFVVRAKRIRM
ncbi:MAG: MFS transporter [Sphaerochaetaceae bacterium]